MARAAPADERDYAMAAVHARIAAFYAQWRHPGLFVSPELERVLLTIGGTAIHPDRAQSPVRVGPPAHVLHVATTVSMFGGIPRLIRRWIQQDCGRTHSVALTRQGPDAVPVALADAVAASG